MDHHPNRRESLVAAGAAGLGSPLACVPSPAPPPSRPPAPASSSARSPRAPAQGRYAARGAADTSNAADGIDNEAGGRALLTLRRKGDRVGVGYTGSLVVGVNPS